MNNRKVIDRFTGEYDFLSNFHPCTLHFERRAYKSLEHAFAAAKTISVTDRYRISVAVSPAEAKRIGRQVLLRDGWDLHLRYTVMETLLALKFQFGTDMRGALLNTGDAVLVEGNEWHDQTWGDCRCGRIACDKPGMNLLGWMLMRRRDELRGES